MRIYKHLGDLVIAEQGNWRFEVARDRLPADPAEALVLLWQKYEAAQVILDPETGQPIEPPALPEPHPELDVDDEAVTLHDFEALADKAAAEIEWLETTIPQVDAMTAAQVRDVVKRLAQENKEMLQAWRYVIRRLS